MRSSACVPHPALVCLQLGDFEDTLGMASARSELSRMLHATESFDEDDDDAFAVEQDSLSYSAFIR